MSDDGADVETPPLIVPPAGQHIWDWYFALSGRLRRVHDGVCLPIPPSEFIAWREACDEFVRPSEYAILCAMDVAYCDEMGKEIKAHRERAANKK